MRFGFFTAMAHKLTLTLAFSMTLAMTFAMTLALNLAGVKAHAAVPNAESKIAIATAYFYKGDYKKALVRANEALRIQPLNREALEMKALILQNMGETAKAYKMYRELLLQIMKDSQTKDELAPYVFQIAIIELTRNEYSKAIKNFKWVRQTSFNTEVAQFFEALALFRSQKFKDSDIQFEKLIQEGDKINRTLLASSHFYRARIAIENDNTELAISFLKNAKAALESDANEINPETLKLSQQINELIDRALSNNQKGRLVAGMETLTEYDSNPLLRSESLASNRSVSTTKQTIVAALSKGQTSASSNAIPWSISLRSIINYNYNKDAKSSEFIANEAEIESLFLPIGKVNRLGILLRGMILFHNQSESGGEDFFRHIQSGAADLIFSRITPSGQWRLEAGGGNAEYTNDSDFQPTLHRSGGTLDGLIAWSRDREQGRLNPTIRLEYLYQQTEGTEYRGTQMRLVLINSIYLQKWKWVMLGATGNAHYLDRDGGPRHDTSYSVDTVGSRNLGDKAHILLRAGWAINNSDIPDTFAYQRYVVGLGLRYVF